VGVYRGIWRYTSVDDLPRFLGAVLAGSAASLMALKVTGLGQGLSRSMFIINGLVQFLLLAGSRVSLRLMRDHLRASRAGRRPALVVGLSEGAEPGLRRLLHDPGWGLSPLGAICENRDAIGLRLLGVPVLGTSWEIREVLAGSEFVEVVLLDENYPREAWERISRACAELGLPARVVRNTIETADGGPLSAVGA